MKAETGLDLYLFSSELTEDENRIALQWIVRDVTAIQDQVLDYSLTSGLSKTISKYNIWSPPEHKANVR